MRHLKTFQQINESMNSDDIPVLSDKSAWEEIEAYLKWLGNSEFEYHIDDNPEDIESIDTKAQEVLRNNSNIMWGFNDRPENKGISDEKMMNMLWDAYDPKSIRESLSEAETKKPKPKPMSEMTKTEKIASYRKKISDERKKPAPDLDKIAGYNAKIADIEAKAKKKESKK
jgi:hypothetical protein